jgi:hypothetical protein
MVNLLKSVLGAVGLAGLALPTANAQNAIFHEDFESGSARWTLQGDWHLQNVAALGTCGITDPNAPSGASAAHFGVPAFCYFNVAKGRMVSVDPIAIPAGVQAARLRFVSYENTECGVGNCGWDHRSLFVSNNGGASWALAWEGGQENLWIEKSVDLSSYQGQDILLAFEFDAIDGYGNHFIGWLVDDVQVEVDEQGGPTIYCAPKLNSQGCGPLMSYSGDPSLSGPDDLVLATSNLRNNVYGSFAWSTGINNVPFQGGTLCVQIPARRTTTIPTGGTPAPTLDCSGSYSWHFSHDYLIVNGIEPGETVHCQYFGRDVGTGAPMTLSNAVAVTILP